MITSRSCTIWYS